MVDRVARNHRSVYVTAYGKVSAYSACLSFVNDAPGHASFVVSTTRRVMPRLFVSTTRQVMPRDREPGSPARAHCTRTRRKNAPMRAATPAWPTRAARSATVVAFLDDAPTQDRAGATRAGCHPEPGALPAPRLHGTALRSAGPRRSLLRLRLLRRRRVAPDADARSGPEGEHLRLLHSCRRCRRAARRVDSFECRGPLHATRRHAVWLARVCPCRSGRKPHPG